MTSKIYTTPVADSVPFDDSQCNYGKDTVQEMLEEICERLKITRPSYSWGRSGNVSNGGWLLNNGVPSNRVGIPFNLVDGKISNIWVGNQDVNTFSIALYEHDGDSVNLNLLATVSVTSARSKFFTEVDFGTVAVAQGKQLAVRVASGSTKNPEVFVQISGE